MIHLASTSDRQAGTTHAGGGRAGLSGLMRQICVDIGAGHYLLVEPAAERGPQGLRILASNWVYDAIEELGGEGVFGIIESGHAAGAGETPQPMSPDASFLSPQERLALREYGHAELFVQRLSLRGRSIFVLFSASCAGSIAEARLPRAVMMCRYALDGYLAATTDRPAFAGALSERERECLRWVSEGKTTDEVALILGVSSNTVNSYVAHAIQKFGASNRAMAIATAIRSGVI